jgi:hypothetical protein
MLWWSRGATALSLVSAVALCACTSTAPINQSSAPTGQFVANQIPSWAGGEPVGTPTNAAPTTYPNVYDQPPQRHSQVLTADEQRKIAADLNSSRNRVDARIKSARAHDEENTAAAVSATTKGQVGQVDDPTSHVH